MAPRCLAPRHRRYLLPLLPLLLLIAACGTTGAVAPRPAAPEAPRPLPVASPEIRAEAASQVLLAREQARLGLYDGASAAWDRAVAILTPASFADPDAAAMLKAVEAERDRAAEEAALHETAGPEEEQPVAPQVEESTEVLQGPEPLLDPKLLGDVRQAISAVHADYSVDVNDQVLAWVEVLSRGRLRGWFTQSLNRSGLWLDRFRQIFAEEGLPQDLVYLAHMESAFNQYAYSRARARGIFQFIAETGRRYGLRVDGWVDERSDPEKSCRAAASYLRDLYAEFNDWNLALASYNVGEGRIRALVAQTGERDYWHFTERRLIPAETRNYVPAILAATIIAKDPARFGLDKLALQAPVAAETVAVPTSTDLTTLATCAKTDLATLRALNPELRRGVTPPGDAPYRLRVPVGHTEGFAEALAAVPVEKRFAHVEHVVRRGDTVGSVARRYRVSSAALREANALDKRGNLAPGQVLVVPRGAGWGGPDVDDQASRGGDAAPAAGGAGYYRVRPGDTLFAVAQRFKVTTASLQAWNGMGKRTDLTAGATLRVQPPSEARSAPAGRYRAAKVHTVRPGETLWQIAANYGTSIDELRANNKLGSGSALGVGQKLMIPAQGKPDRPAVAQRNSGTVHIVQKGETLFRIAQIYGLTVEKLCRLNSLSMNAVLQPGTSITVRR